MKNGWAWRASYGPAWLLACVLALPSASCTKAGGTARGFVITKLAPAADEEHKSQCPAGLVEGAKPGLQIVQGMRAHGLDLDKPAHNKGLSGVCAHENFVGSNGESGIDNQMYRALGCMKAYYPGGALHEYFNVRLRNGDFAILVQIDGIDDPMNDDKVRVGFYRAASPTANIGNMATIPALQLHYDKHYHSTTPGRIVDGVLITEPVDLRLKMSPRMQEFVIRDARVRMKFQPEGHLNGILGGYQQVDTFFRIAKRALESEATPGPMDFLPVLQRLADGYPDPMEDGPCTWLSSAFAVEAVPATVVHVKAQQNQ